MSVHVILVTFEDKTVGTKAMRSSEQQKELQETVPIDRYGITFKYQKKVTIFRP